MIKIFIKIIFFFKFNHLFYHYQFAFRKIILELEMMIINIPRKANNGTIIKSPSVEPPCCEIDLVIVKAEPIEVFNKGKQYVITIGPNDYKFYIR
jgi:hypothetical protein